MFAGEDEGLGALIERYETDNHRRRSTAIAAIVVGLLVACLGVLLALPLWLGDREVTPGAQAVPALVIGAGLGGLLMGIVQGRRSLGRDGEVFALHENGLVHSYPGHTHAIRWEDVVKVTDSGRDTALARAFGSDVNCSIRVNDGTRVVITGFTDYADRLAEAVEEATARHISR